MKKEKLLAALNKAIKAAEMVMESSMEDSTKEGKGTLLVGGGTSKTVMIKRADFSKPFISMIEYAECPEGRCDPDEFNGRCCIFDATTGWTCVGGLMASECAQQGGIYESRVACDSQPPCGSSFTPTTSPIDPGQGQTSNISQMRNQ
jgi:hypothetical protein